MMTLVVDLELILIQCISQLGFEFEAPHHAVVHGPFVDCNPIPAGRFCLRHRPIRVAQDGFCGGRRDDLDDADACRDRHASPAERVWFAQSGEQRVGQRCGVTHRASLEEGHEFVSAQASGQITSAKG
jgi:hypothetical protein